MSINQINPKGDALYLQIKDVLIERIQTGAWKSNTLIPTEQALIKEFGVSRTTIRQAITILVQNGLLEKKQGHGTIVKPHQLVGNLGQLKGFAEEVMEKGQVPSSKVIRAEFKYNLFHESEMLQVAEGSPILLVERIRFADETPVALERTCWPESIGKLLIQHDLNEAKYYEILENYQIYLNKAQERIAAINATLDEADSLAIRPGEALLEMTRLSYGLNDHLIEYTKTKYRSDQYHYNIELKR
ncbi:GntR family transcriptional regulator [Pseudalkalibacillus hwajinpoensis]|uniref:GntR family transcriptional regulator n=1 Tax=Guptibacillus hwajinpoensis TaxID=208199 RepID=UPI001F55859B|nr:GntR family transcriptional regulator [Pseudalkalibacillus hwajinpoensis]